MNLTELTSHYYLVDDGNFARHDVAQYQSMATYLAAKGLRPPSLNEVRTHNDVLAACHAEYGPHGLTPLQRFQPGPSTLYGRTVSFKNIRRVHFFDYMRELWRILKPNGSSSHVIPLNDQFVGGLNRLRIPSAIWRAAAMAKCGPCTNRLRYSEMLAIFKRAGFESEVVAIQKWQKLPTPRRKFQKPFRDMPDDELRILNFEVVLRPIQVERGVGRAMQWLNHSMRRQTKIACKV